MGLWNLAGRWLVWAVGLLLVLLGGGAVWQGIDIIQVERGWASVIAGSTALCSGCLILVLGLLIDRVDALRLTLMDRQMPLVASREREDDPTGDLADELPLPKPVEVPVEPPPAPSQSVGLRYFGKRQPGVVPVPQTVEPAPLAPGAPADPESPAAGPVPEEPSEQVRRFAPPQFRRPSFLRPSSETPPLTGPEEPVAPQASEAPVAIEPVPQPEPQPAPPPLPPLPEPVAEDVHLPRAVPMPPLPPMPSPADEPASHPGESLSPAQQHEWLEKALIADEPEPALDWLRKRRSEEMPRAERRLPAFMRRREDAPAPEPVHEPVVAHEPEAVKETPAPAEAPTVVGRYSANGSDYTLYSDGTIDAQSPEGTYRFASMKELRAHLENQAPQAAS